MSAATHSASPATSDGAPRDRAQRVGLFLLLLGIYLLTASRERPWSDGELMFQVAQALVERRGVEILWSTPPYSFAGPDGGIYSSFPLLSSLVLVPSVWVLRALGPSWQLFALPLAAQVPSALSSAGAVAAFHALCRRLGIGRRGAVVASLMLGLSTFVWVYARRPYSESLQLLVFLLFVLAALRWRERARRADALALGAAAGLMLNTEIVLALGALGGLAVLVAERARSREGVGSMLAWFACGLAPWLALFAAYDLGRWDAVFLTGYEQVWALPRESTFWGVVGLAFSPGKSIFLYCPPLLSSPFGLRGLWKARRRESLFLVAATLPPMLAVASLQTWSGGWCWGPRVWLFATPVLLLPAAWWIDGLLQRPRTRARAYGLALAGALAFGGGAVQLLGNAFYWDHHVRLARQVQQRWLGRPNRDGAILKPIERRACDPCIEDMHGVLWLPAFSPIVGHAWMLRHVAQDSPPEHALKDAPWRRYTTLEVDLSSTFRRATLDWWGMLWLDRFPERRPAGIVLLLSFVGLTLAGGWQLRRAPR